jgi:hypothetical protein
MKHFHVLVITGQCVPTLNTENPSLLGCDTTVLDYIISRITNKMQRYTIFFITVSALHVSGGFSAHHREPETCRALTIKGKGKVTPKQAYVALKGSGRLRLPDF